MQTIKKIKKESKQAKNDNIPNDSMLKKEIERHLDEFIMNKRVKLISKDNSEMLDPIM
jgi:hypothetical protein